MEKESYWKRHVGAVERSGLKAAEYCRREGIRENQLSYWKSRLGAKKPEFARVGGGVSFEIELSNGALVRIPADITGDVLKGLLEAVNALGN